MMRTALATVENLEILRSEETKIPMNTGSISSSISETLLLKLKKQKNTQFIHSETRSQKKITT